jgi:hypothetical protein
MTGLSRCRVNRDQFRTAEFAIGRLASSRQPHVPFRLPNSVLRYNVNSRLHDAATLRCRHFDAVVRANLETAHANAAGGKRFPRFDWKDGGQFAAAFVGVADAWIFPKAA